MSYDFKEAIRRRQWRVIADVSLASGFVLMTVAFVGAMLALEDANAELAQAKDELSQITMAARACLDSMLEQSGR